MRTVGEGTESWTGHVERFEHSTEWEQVNGIPPFFIGMITTRFDIVVHKQIMITKCGVVTAASQHGEQHITCFRLGGCDELS